MIVGQGTSKLERNFGNRHKHCLRNSTYSSSLQLMSWTSFGLPGIKPCDKSNAYHLAGRIKKINLEHVNAWQNLHPSTIRESWISPPWHTLKINFDEAIRDEFSLIAAVCCDSKDCPLYAWTKIWSPCDANTGEALCSSYKLCFNFFFFRNFILCGELVSQPRENASHICAYTPRRPINVIIGAPYNHLYSPILQIKNQCGT